MKALMAIKKDKWIPILCLIGFTILISSCSINKVIHFQDKYVGNNNYSEREALVILPGFGDDRQGRKNLKEYFKNKGYDLYIPIYKYRISYEDAIDSLSQFMRSERIKAYNKVHVFSFIMGSWVLNDYINKEGIGNIKTIVYDRSPLQERAPRLAGEKLKYGSKIIYGPILRDFSKVVYPSIDTSGLKVGILVENRATLLIRLYKKTALSYGPINWDPKALDQDYMDLIYINTNHDEMYTDVEEYGAEILHFIEQNSFRKDARRIHYDKGIFAKTKKKLERINTN